MHPVKWESVQACSESRQREGSQHSNLAALQKANDDLRLTLRDYERQIATLSRLCQHHDTFDCRSAINHNGGEEHWSNLGLPAMIGDLPECLPQQIVAAWILRAHPLFCVQQQEEWQANEQEKVWFLLSSSGLEHT